MAFIATEGFDSYVASAGADDVGLVWSTVGTGADFTFETGRHGIGQCIRMLAGATTLSLPMANVADVKVAFSYKIEGLPGFAKSMFEVIENSTYHCGFDLQSNGAVTAVRYDLSHVPTILASSPKLLRTDTWYTFKLLITIGNSISADSFILLVNDEEWLNVPATSDTQNNGFGLANSFVFGLGGTIRSIDDFYMMDAADPWPDEHRVDTIRPNAIGTTNDWLGSDADSVDNHLHVDEVTPDGDTTYVESSTVGQIDLYNLESLPIIPIEIYCANTCSICKKTDAGSRTVKHIARTGGANFEGALTHYPSAVSYSRQANPYTLNPDTGVKWVQADIDALQSGLKIES